MNFVKRTLAMLAPVVVCACLISACNAPQAPGPTETPPSATQTLAPTATVLPVLTTEMLQNGTYQTPQYKKTVTLKNGKYEAGTGTDYFMATLLPQQAKGDLNGDGVEDAVILLAENGGGSGVFVSVVGMLNQNGKPVQTSGALIDDRPKIDSVEIKHGEIVVNGVIHGVNDPMVSPTLGVSETYQLVNMNLELVKFTSKVADGGEHSIAIESPADGAEVSGSVQVKGSMPIGPFENTLAYHVLDASGKELASGPFMVKSDGAGAAATFDNAIDLSAIAKGSAVRLELVEVSMANGATMALDSVALVVK